jgi:hypothetical protein
MPAVDEITSRLVTPFYLRVLHGNVVSPGCAGERDALLMQMRAVAPAVTFGDALHLWPRGWRESLMASWWAAVWRWPEVIGQVEPLLIPSRSCFEGQAHCLALAQVNSQRSRAVLVRYLDEYLPRRDLSYDQPWAMAALTVACANAGEPVPGRCEAAWRQWSSATSHADLGAYADTVSQMLAFADSVARRSP